MGYKHLTQNQRIRAVAFHLAGLKPKEVERQLGVSDATVYRLAADPTIRQEAQAVVDLAREEATKQALIAAGWVIGKDGRRFSPDSIRRLREGGKRYQNSLTPEQRHARAVHSSAVMTPEQRSERARKSNAAQTPEQRSARGKKAAANMTPEARKERSRKAVETRLRNQAANAARNS